MLTKSYGYMSTANDTVAGPAGTFLWKIDVGTAVATAVVTVYNGTSTSDPVVATIDAATNGCHHFEGIHLAKGLFVKLTTANAKVTAVYS